ncbi:MAG: hypothetical protein ACYTFA_13765, partial [Planctomycetota bacterium]
MKTVLMAMACLTPGLLLADPGASGPLDIADLQARVARLHDRVGELAGAEDLLDTLHFGWFDRPYARATLAIAVKTTSVIQREIHLRMRGNGAIPDASLRAMLVWADEALGRAVESRADGDFRPHRLRLTGAGLCPSARAEARGSLTPALFAFVDRATSTRHHASFGDLDLTAAVGSRIYARLEGEPGCHDALELRDARSDALGMASVVLKALQPETEHGHSRRVASLEVSEAATEHALTVESLTLRALIAYVPASTGKSMRPVAIVDPPSGESWASSLARRALARGALNQTRYMAAGWTLPAVQDPTTNRSGKVAAAMWVHAIDGQSVGLLPGWRDLRDGSASPYPSVATNPARVETIAHTALDLIRLGRYIAPLRTTSGVVIAIGPEAVDPDDDNAWAGWIEPVWSALHRRQIRFDIVGRSVPPAELARRYPVVLQSQRDQVGDLPSLLRNLEEDLLQQPARTQRVTAHEPNSQLAKDLFIRSGPAPDGRSCLAIVNLCDRPRRLHLRSPVELGTATDVVAGELLADSG